MLIFNRYEYDPQKDYIGQGGFSEVYKAIDTKLNRVVALKFFKGAQSAAKYSLSAEIKRVIGLEHPNICRYYDVEEMVLTTAAGRQEKTEVAILDFIDGGSLGEYFSAHRDSDNRKKLLVDVLQGLAYLHENSIIHRDIKPDNILIRNTRNGPVAKIVDFGISKNVDSSHSQSSSVLGSIEYMAPEQFNAAKYGINGKIATNLDLWAFGIMTYDLLQSKPLFGSRTTGDTSEQVMHRILGDEIGEKLGGIEEPIRTMIIKCLVKDANQRVRNANELITMLTVASPPPQMVITNDNLTNNEATILPKQNQRPSTEVISVKDIVREDPAVEEKVNHEVIAPPVKNPVKGITNIPVNLGNEITLAQVKEWSLWFGLCVLIANILVIARIIVFIYLDEKSHHNGSDILSFNTLLGPALIFIGLFSFSLWKCFNVSLSKIVSWIIPNIVLFFILRITISFLFFAPAITGITSLLIAFFSMMLFMMVNSYFFKQFTGGTLRKRAWWFLGLSNIGIKITGSLLFALYIYALSEITGSFDKIAPNVIGFSLFLPAIYEAMLMTLLSNFFLKRELKALPSFSDKSSQVQSGTFGKWVWGALAIVLIIAISLMFIFFKNPFDASVNQIGRDSNFEAKSAKVEGEILKGEIGEAYGGGVIFYLDATGKHGLIAAESDLGNAAWGCRGSKVIHAQSSSADGTQLTPDIVEGCAEEGTAAKLCAAYDFKGYNDWYLPSKKELDKLYQVKDQLGGFSREQYWSSTEYSKDFAYFISFVDNLNAKNGANGKDFEYRVRPIRKF